MTVVPFMSRRSAAVTGAWEPSEIDRMVEACGVSLSRGEISGWEIGSTEAGDPQLYVLGPPPGHECVLCISRVGHVYVVQDGEGRVLAEHDAFGSVVEQVRATFARRKSAIVTKLMAAWFAAREAFEDRIEPVFAEPMEVASHLVPRLAAFV